MDESLRYKYDLNPDSLVFDLGAYEGEFIDGIYDKFNCFIRAYEPIKIHFDVLKEKYSGIPKIFLANHAILDKDFKTRILDRGTASSIYLDLETDSSEEIEVKDILSVWNSLGVDKIDLIKINIEGGEYPLLIRMIETGIVAKCQNIQVQFHTFIQNYEEQYESIKAGLSKTHDITWRFPFIWENWKLKA